jgi:GntR family transcriptional regulator, galactonate operon transcriptional repressor
MKPKSFHAAVVDRLAANIVGGTYMPGAQLPPEAALCASLGVSRTILREAVKTLCAKGMVVTGPRLGTRAQPCRAWNVLDPDVITWRLAAGVDDQFVGDILELRRAIEPEAAALAALRATDSERDRLRDANRRMNAAMVEGTGGYLEADLEFHETILLATRNQFFAAMRSAVGALLRVSFQLSINSRATARPAMALHDSVLDAIEARDAEAARRTVLVIIEQARADIERNRAQEGFTASGSWHDA